MYDWLYSMWLALKERQIDTERRVQSGDVMYPEIFEAMQDKLEFLEWRDED